MSSCCCTVSMEVKNPYWEWDDIYEHNAYVFPVPSTERAMWYPAGSSKELFELVRRAHYHFTLSYFHRTCLDIGKSLGGAVGGGLLAGTLPAGSCHIRTSCTGLLQGHLL